MYYVKTDDGLYYTGEFSWAGDAETGGWDDANEWSYKEGAVEFAKTYGGEVVEKYSEHGDLVQSHGFFGPPQEKPSTPEQPAAAKPTYDEPEELIGKALYLLQLCQQDLNIGRKETIWPRAKRASGACQRLEEMFRA